MLDLISFTRYLVSSLLPYILLMYRNTNNSLPVPDDQTGVLQCEISLAT